jgi:hypothetical protein
MLHQDSKQTAKQIAEVLHQSQDEQPLQLEQLALRKTTMEFLQAVQKMEQPQKEKTESTAVTMLQVKVGKLYDK